MSDKALRARIAGLRSHREYNLKQVAGWTHELRESVVKAHAAGIPETELARLAGVTRMTIRAWLGKGGGARG